MDIGPRSAGEIVDAGTRIWVRVTGRRVDIPSEAWLDGPTGDTDGVLRTDHAIDLGRLPVLRLHYRLDPVG